MHATFCLYMHACKHKLMQKQYKLIHSCTYIHTLRTKCRGLLLACCSCAVACGPVCRPDRWSFTASPGLSVEFTGRGRQFIRAQQREREKERRGDREKGRERWWEREALEGGVSMKMEGKIGEGRGKGVRKNRERGER